MELIEKVPEHNTPVQTALQKAKSKYYYKNKESISEAYKIYYQSNRLKISSQRRESYAKKRLELGSLLITI